MNLRLQSALARLQVIELGLRHLAANTQTDGEPELMTTLHEMFSSIADQIAEVRRDLKAGAAPVAN